MAGSSAPTTAAAPSAPALRPRKLLLHKRELRKLIGKVTERGLTLIPTRMYFKNGRLKVEIALARGKRQHDRRAAEREKDVKRDVAALYARSLEFIANRPAESVTGQSDYSFIFDEVIRTIDMYWTLSELPE